jgi:hypothetical protein
VSLPIQTSTTNNCVTADSEIDSQIVPLTSQKLTAKNCVAANSKIGNDDGVISALLLSLFFGCLHNICEMQVVFIICNSRVANANCDT